MDHHGRESSTLRRELTVWEAIGISLAVMAPSMAANINPQGPAGQVGRAVPLTFALAAAGVLLVAYGFVRLCRKYQHAGSVYGLVGVSVGPRAGFVAGWTLLGTYMLYSVVTAIAAGIFLRSLLASLEVWHAPVGFAFAVAAGALSLAFALALRPALRATRLLLIAEGATVLLILIVSVVVLVRLIAGDAPNGASFDLHVFSVPDGVPTSNVALGAVFGFLSFAGFEAAASLGEETKDGRRDIPRSVLGVAIFGGVFFILVTAIEVMGFGTDEKGLASFASSGSLLGDLSTDYVGAWLGDLITLGAAVSAAACSVACTVAASRLLFALARDLAPDSRLAAVSDGSRVPAHAAGCVVAAALAALATCAAFTQEPFDVFAWTGTIGTLMLLVAYLLVTFGALRVLNFGPGAARTVASVLIPSAGIVVLGYVLYRNVWPYPSGPGRWFPVIAGCWVAAATAASIARPALARTIGERLAADEGLKAPVAAAGPVGSPSPVSAVGR